ncbi:MAG: hypothetical protein PVI27_10500 [Desulfobacteraceae bacterium]|jgi:hypothetical protein
MKKLLFVVIMFSLTGCYSFGRGVASRVIENLEKEDTRQCEIRGSQFNGIASYLDQGETVKVLIVHGIGTHRPGHSAIISESIARTLGLFHFSKPRDVDIMNPKSPDQRLANLRIITMRNPDASKKLVFYELTWSDITADRKRVLDFDTSGEFAHRRASFNNAMKAFLNDVGPDPMIYVTDPEKLVLRATQQAICWMLAGGEGEEINNQQGSVCSVSSLARLSGLEKYNIVFITHSLGSRIIMDALGEIVETLGDDQIVSGNPALVSKMQAKEMTVFMLSNQMPLLQIGLPAPAVVGQIAGYCREGGQNFARRAFKKLDIVAFTDPNDLLSYSITQDFVDHYLDSRMCPVVTNIHINVADRLTAFGIDVVNPIAAHGNYDSDERVIELISHGNTDFDQNEFLSDRCRMIEIENR